MGAVYLVRHGQASFGQDNYDQLSDTGFEQARVLGEALRARLTGLDAVFLGTLARHRQTAETCLAALGMNVPQRVLPGFDEFNHDELVHRHTPRYADPAVLRAELLQAEDPRRAFQALFAQAVERWVTGPASWRYIVGDRRPSSRTSRGGCPTRTRRNSLPIR